MAGLAYIHNLASDTSVWTLAGAHARPRLDWSYSDADGHAQNAYRVRIYSASSGGSLLHDSGKVSSSSTLYDAPWAGVYDTAYYWTIEVWDSLGDSSGESGRTAFKMLWSQVIYEYAVPSGATSSSWKFTQNSGGTGQTGFLFASATGAGGSGRSAWKSNIGALTPNAYVNIMVRLAATTSGSKPNVGDMKFSYTASGVRPDKWSFDYPERWTLDSDVLRFGSKALKFVQPTTGTAYSAAYISTNAPGIPVNVEPNTTYTMSVYVRTNGPLNGVIFLAVTNVLPEGVDDQTYDVWEPTRNTPGGFTSDSSGEPSGWQRLKWTFTTGTAGGHAWPEIRFQPPTSGSAVGDMFWVDGFQLEIGSVASPWRPGMVSDASILDVTGVQIDAASGGMFRLRGSNGTANDIVELGANGLEVTGEIKRPGEAWIPVTYLNSWTSYNASTWGEVAYRKDAQGYVHLRGMAALGSSATATIFTLPVGYRPGKQLMFTVPVSGGPARLDIATGGGVFEVVSAGFITSTAWVSLNGIVFKAEL